MRTVPQLTPAAIPEPVSSVQQRRIGFRLHFADLLVPFSITLWALGVKWTNVTNLGPYGLVTALPAIFYLGVGLLVASFIISFRREQPDNWRMVVHVVVMIVMLYGTAALVYPDGRYAWLYKTIGVIQYVNVHGQLNRYIDIYQNWPGFFAAAAWFDKVAGLASPFPYAKWAQMAFELAALPLLYTIFVSLRLTVRQRWIALVLYFASNWIAQDYLSPQALGTLLSLGILAIVCRFLLADGAPLWRRRKEPQSRVTASPSDGTPSSKREIVAVCTVLIATFFVLSFTHELTPYVLIVQLGALAVAGRMRQRWLPIVLAAIAIGYLIPRFTFVNTKYGLLASIGNFFSNAATPASLTKATASQKLLERSAEALSIFMWGLAIVGAWMRRRAGQPVLALALLAFSPAFVILFVHYGNEATLRVYLYSLPWSAALASCALDPSRARAVQPFATKAPAAQVVSEIGSSPLERTVPSIPAWSVFLLIGATVRRALVGITRLPHALAHQLSKAMQSLPGSQSVRKIRVRSMSQPIGAVCRSAFDRTKRLSHAFARKIAKAQQSLPGWRPERRTIRLAVALVVTVGLFFPAFYGNDRYYEMTPTEVSTVTAFLQKATPGPLFVAIDNGPYADTARYNLFMPRTVFESGGVVADDPLEPNFAIAIEEAAVSYTGGSEPSYVLVTPSMYAYDEAYLVTPLRNFERLVKDLAHTPPWKLLAHRGDTYIYELPATVRS